MKKYTIILETEADILDLNNMITALQDRYAVQNITIGEVRK